VSAGAAPAPVPAEVLEYLREQNTMTLATATSNGVPRAATFLYVNDGPTLYFWTRAGTTTARHIDQNPSVAFAIGEYSSDLSQTRGLQGSGECKVLLSGEEIARVADLFGQKFPSLSPGNTLSISFYKVLMTEVDFIDNARSPGGRADGTFGAEFHRERSYSVFTTLPRRESGDLITGTLLPLSLEPGEVLVRQGGPADKFFIVVDGKVSVVREEDGHEQEVAVHGPGDLIGEVAVLEGRSRAATVRAVEATNLLSIDRETFLRVVGQSLGTTGDFDKIIQSRLSAMAGGA
jgi:uncharacterized protein YhbP (UPF0306 family)